MDTIAEIERDLAAFADPGVPVIIDKSSAVWEQGGRQMVIEFSRPKDGGLPNVEFEGARLSYRQFLAGSAMADLKRLASFILKAGRRTENFIDTSATWEDDDAEDHTTSSATALIGRRATEDLPFLSTRVVLVQGEAGSGKTIALRELAASQARLYEMGGASVLYFYVNAQGRALSRLEDAMAKDLQDLRSSFSYAAIAPLTRRHLVVPIIDGFDELLGSGGYDEAFSSLAALLSLLAGQGAVIASARSAFFDYRNFYENAKKFSGDGDLNYVVDVVKVRPWTGEQVRTYFTAVAEDRGKPAIDMLGALSGIRAELSAQDQELLSKPFYASRVAELVLAGETFGTADALLDQLVDAFLEREHKKLLDKEGRPLLSKKGHRAFLVQLAEEMWWQESRQVDVGTVQTVAEMVVESFGLPPGSVRAIVERVSSYAFLSAEGVDTGALRFEHEVFYSYFLAHKFRECVESAPGDLRRLLNRAVLDETLAMQTARLIGGDSERCSRAIAAISGELRLGATEVISRSNAGRLIAAILNVATSVRNGLTIANVVFKQVSFGNVMLHSPIFERCDFDEVDLTGTRMIKPRFDECAIRSVIVDANVTRLDAAVLGKSSQVYSIEVATGDGTVPPGRFFAPEEMGAILKRLGTDAPDAGNAKDLRSGTAAARIALLGKFLQKMTRRFYISQDDLKRFSFTRDAEWDVVYARLIEHRILEEHLIVKSGPREPLLKLTLPPDIVHRGENAADASLPAAVQEFWKDLRSA